MLFLSHAEDEVPACIAGVPSSSEVFDSVFTFANERLSYDSTSFLFLLLL